MEEKEDYPCPHDEHSIDIGVSIGKYDAWREAQAAFDKGEIELWLDYNRPKTLEAWKEWRELHGSHEDMEARWKD